MRPRRSCLRCATRPKRHPTDEHLLPFFFALGAGGDTGARIHHSYTHGVLAMDAYAFGGRDTVQRLGA